MINIPDESDSEVKILLENEEKDEWGEFSETDETSSLATKNGVEEPIVMNRPSLASSKTSKFVVLRVYKRRWFILGLFSLLSFMQVHNTFLFKM